MTAIPQEPKNPQGDPDFDKKFRPSKFFEVAGPALTQLGYEMSQEAQGLGEHIQFHGAAAAKAAGDGMLNVVHGVHKLAAGIGGGIGAKLSGDEWSKGWNYGVEDVREALRKAYGTADPGILDWMATMRNGGEPMQSAVYDPSTGTVREVSVGEAGDQLIQDRLGRSAAASQTVGALLSFATGPSAAIGRGGAAVSNIVTRRIDTAIARSLTRGMRGFEEAAVVGSKEAMKGWGRKSVADVAEKVQTAWGKTLKRGDALTELGRNEAWKAAATNYQRAARLGGRTFTEMLDLTAGNVAQSYFVEKDEDRVNGMVSAAAVSWLAGPLARLGQSMGNKVMTAGLLRSPEQTKALGDIYQKLATGKLTIEAADKAIGQAAPMFGRRLFANALSSSVEGTGFLMLPMPGDGPDAWELWKQWQAGDDDAGSALFAMWVGTAAGIAATKYAVPQNLAPMFKELRPDLNTLQIHMEAEAYRRLTKEESEGLRKEAAVRARPQDRPTGFDLDAPPSDTQKEALADLGKRAKFQRDLSQGDVITAPRQPIAVDDMAAPLAAKVAEVADSHAWAEPWSAAPLRAGWEPEFLDGGDIRWTTGRDYHATMSNAGGRPSLVLNEAAVRALRAYDREPATTMEGHPDRRRVAPEAVEQTLDDLAMVAWSSRMQGTLAFERLGMTETAPGIWHNEETGAWYTMDLEGRVRTRMPQESGWSKPHEMAVVDGLGEPDFATEGSIALKAALAAKLALAPDAAVDTVLTRAINLAEHSDSAGAKELRQFFALMDPVELRSMLEQGKDEWLAYTLGSLATRHNNAENAVREVLSDKEVGIRQEGVRVRLLEQQKRDRLTADQGRREEFVAKLRDADVPAKTFGRARLSTQDANLLRRYLPDDSPAWDSVSAEVAKLAKAGQKVKSLRVSVGELRDLAEQWTRAIGERRNEPFEDTEASRAEELAISRIDDWFSSLAADMGLEPMGETAGGVGMDVPAAPQRTPRDFGPDQPPPAGPDEIGPPAGPDQPLPRPPMPQAETLPAEAAQEPAGAPRTVEAPDTPSTAGSRKGGAADAATDTGSREGLSAEKHGLGRGTEGPAVDSKRPVAPDALADLEQNIRSTKKLLDDAVARHRTMKALPLEQRASKATSRAMTDLETQIERLRRRVRAQTREAELVRRERNRTPEEQAEISRKMRELRSKPLNAHQFIARMGGIKVDIVAGRKVAPKGWPLDSSPETLNMKVGGKPLFTGNGMPMESALQSLIENGYYPGRSIFGGEEATDRSMDLAQEWLDNGEFEFDANDSRVQKMQEREYQKAAEEQGKAQKAEERREMQRLRAIEEASRKRGVGRRLADIERMQKAKEGATKRPMDKDLPDVTPEQVAMAEDVLMGERQSIEEGGRATLSAEDFTALTAAATDKQKVALAAEIRLEAYARMAREQGRTEDADRIDNLLRTGGAKQIQKEVSRLDGENMTFSGIGGMVPAKMRAKFAEAMAKGGTARKALDWAITDRIEVLEKYAPGHPWIADFKEARTMLRQGIGEAQILFSEAERPLKKMKARAMSLVDVNETPYYRWKALAEGRVEPATPEERTAADAMRKAGLFLWQKGVDAGVRRRTWNALANDGNGEWQFKPITSRDSFIMPRTQGADWDAFMGSKDSRMRLWQWVVDHNPDLQIAERLENGRVKMDHGKPVLRRMTAADLEARFTTEPDQRIESAEEQAAFEFVREIKNFPDVFEGAQLTEANPFEAFRRIIHEQIGRAAAVKVWGQDFSPKVRAAIETAEGVKLPPGAEAAMREFGKALNDTGSVGTGSALKRDAEDLLVTLQGTNPMKLHPVLRALQPLEGFARAAMTWKSWIHDVPAPIIQGAAYAGWRRMLRVLGKTVTSPREMIVAAERVGSLFRNTGIKDPVEADSSIQKFADRVGWLSMQSERIKTAMFDRMAVEMLADWAKGKPRVTGNDRDVVNDLLAFTPDEQASLLSGKAPQMLQTRFRHEFVKLTTGRRTRVEGSKFLASPNLQASIRFGNWISGRMVEIQRLSRGFGPGKTAAQRARAAQRLLTLTTGYAALGTAVSSVVSYLLVDAFKGENGWDRLVRDMSYAPGAMVGKALMGQVLGGPTAQMWSAIQSPDKAKTWANLIAPIGMAHAVASKVADAWQQTSYDTPGEVAESVGHLLWAATGQAAVEAGVVPADARNLAALLQGWRLGQDKDQRRDDQMVRAWKRTAGVEDPIFARNKAPAFYDALGNIRRAIGRHVGEPGGVQKALAEAEADLRVALSLAQEEGVAQAIRSFQHLDGVPPEQRQQIAEYADDDETMQRIYAHDLAVRELAKAVGRMQGGTGSSAEQEIELAANQARLGAGDAWNKVVDRVTDDAVFALEARQAIPSDVRELAEAMASHPQTLTWLPPKSLRALSRPGLNRATRARMLQTIITRRARERAKQR